MYFKYLISWEIHDHWHLLLPPPSTLELSENRQNVLERVKVFNSCSPPKPTNPITIIDNDKTHSFKKFYKSLVKEDEENGIEKKINEAMNSSASQPLPNSTNFASTTFPSVPFHPLPVDSGLQKYIDRNSNLTPPALGAGVPGPPLLVRVALALKSQQDKEVDWAIGHLIKISFERHQEFKLERLPSLAECLVYSLGFQVTKAKQVSDLTDISLCMDRAIGIALVLRNSVLSVENAKHVAQTKLVISVLEASIRCAKTFNNLEFLHYCLDISEMISSYLHVEDEKNVFYLALCEFLNSSDYSILIATLRTLARLALNDRNNRLLQDLKSNVIANIIALVETDNEEIVAAALDFLYQYTTYRTNTSNLLASQEAWMLVDQLIRLMMYQAQERFMTVTIENSESNPAVKHEATSSISLPMEELQQLVAMREPERSVKWMRCCFEPSSDDYVLQTDIWQLYCSDMERAQGPNVMGISPADFIKVSSHAFYNARAMTVSTPQLPVEYVINGIKRRKFPTSVNGMRYQPCRWCLDSGKECGELLLGTPLLHSHLQEMHIFPQILETGKCRWSDCKYEIQRLTPASELSHYQLLSHIVTHLHDDSLETLVEGRKLSPSREFRIPLLLTAVDDQGDATGIALTATLVLRNLVRSKQGKMLFSAIESRVLEVSSLNPAVAPYVSEMLLGQI